MTRETSVKIKVLTSDLDVQSPAYLVYDFSGKINLIKRDYEKLKKPLVDEIKGVEETLLAAKADLAGREERRKLLLDAIQEDEKEIPKILKKSRNVLQSLWEAEGGKLDQDYNVNLNKLFRQIEDRATELGLKYNANF